MTIYAFYADVFWMNNTLMNGAILLIVRMLQAGHLHRGRQGKWMEAYGAKLWRIAVSASCGGLLEVLLLLFVRSYVGYLALSHLFVIPLMVLIAFGRSTPGKFLRRIFLCYGAAVGLGGILTALENTFGIGQIPVLGGIVAAILTLSGCRFFYAFLSRQKNLYGLELKNKGAVVQCRGLWDSGNQLREPYGNRPVHILSEAVAGQLLLNETESLGLIPFSALGKSDGVLPIYQLEELRILKEREPICLADAVVAKAQPGLLEKGDFQVILHADTL